MVRLYGATAGSRRAFIEVLGDEPGEKRVGVPANRITLKNRADGQEHAKMGGVKGGAFGSGAVEDTDVQ